MKVGCILLLELSLLKYSFDLVDLFVNILFLDPLLSELVYNRRRWEIYDYPITYDFTKIKKQDSVSFDDERIMFIILFAWEVRYLEIFFWRRYRNIETIYIAVNMISDISWRIKTKFKRFLILKILFLYHRGSTLTLIFHQDFWLEYAWIKVKRNSIVHQHNEVLIEFEYDLSQEGLI